MSEVAPTESKNITNNMSETKTAQNSDASTPASKRPRKRPSEVVDTSLVIETPPGVDGSRRTTRSQTRGTPAPPPAKKMAVEKTPVVKKAPAEKKATPAPKKATPAPVKKAGKAPAVSPIEESEDKVANKPVEANNNNVDETPKKEDKKPVEDKPDGGAVTKPKDVPPVVVAKKPEESKAVVPVPDKSIIELPKPLVVTSSQEKKVDEPIVAPKAADVAPAVPNSMPVEAAGDKAATVPVVAASGANETKPPVVAPVSSIAPAVSVANHDQA